MKKHETEDREEYFMNLLVARAITENPRMHKFVTKIYNERISLACMSRNDHLFDKVSKGMNVDDMEIFRKSLHILETDSSELYWTLRLLKKGWSKAYNKMLTVKLFDLNMGSIDFKNSKKVVDLLYVKGVSDNHTTVCALLLQLINGLRTSTKQEAFDWLRMYLLTKLEDVDARAPEHLTYTKENEKMYEKIVQRFGNKLHSINEIVSGSSLDTMCANEATLELFGYSLSGDALLSKEEILKVINFAGDGQKLDGELYANIKDTLLLLAIVKELEAQKQKYIDLSPDKIKEIISNKQEVLDNVTQEREALKDAVNTLEMSMEAQLSEYKSNVKDLETDLNKANIKIRELEKELATKEQVISDLIKVENPVHKVKPKEDKIDFRGVEKAQIAIVGVAEYLPDYSSYENIQVYHCDGPMSISKDTDIIFVSWKYMTHKAFFKSKAIAKALDIPLWFLRATNETLAIDEMNNFIANIDTIEQ